MSKIDLHNYDERLENTLQRIQDHEEISDENKELAENFINHLITGGKRSSGRVFKYAQNIKKIFQNNDYNFQEIEDNEEWKKKVQGILVDIERSRYYHSDWKPATKEDYYTALIKLIAYVTGEDQPKRDTGLISQDFSAYNNRGNDESNKTRPEDLPTPEDVKKFCRKIEEKHKPAIALRNIALLLLMWDTGARIGEIIQVRLRDVRIRGNQVIVRVPGNKQSKDRDNMIFQGKQTIKDWVQNGHPADPQKNGEAFLFPALWPEPKLETPIRYEGFTKKCIKPIFEELDRNNEVDCEIDGEPNHVFRKGMTTYYVVNDILSHEKVLQRQGKSIKSPTLPDYLRMLMSDVDASAAEGFGVEVREESLDNTAKSMRQEPLLPKKCKECGKESRCYKDFCMHCGSVVESKGFPQGEALEEDEEASVDEMLEKIDSGELPENLVDGVAEKILEKTEGG